MNDHGSDASEIGTLRREVDRLRRELSAARATGEWEAAAAGAADPARDPDTRLALLEAMLETVPVGVVLADERGRIVHGNAWVERMLKHPVLHSADTDSYGEWVSFHADGRRVESHEYPLSRVIRDGMEHSALDVRYRRGDGTTFWMRVIGEPVRDAAGRRVGATVALVDIDEEVRLMEEKEVLLGEVNHRVKNSLQLVGSILALQARGAQGDSVDLLRSASARVQAVAAVHAALYHDEDVRTVEFGDHLRRFCDHLSDGAGAWDRGIAVDVEAATVTLPAETAVPLSLIVNELVTNAFKHAFPVGGARDGGRVAVRFAREAAGRLSLEVANTGLAGPAGDDRRGLGTTLVDTLARQIGATLSRDTEGGWRVRLDFPEPAAVA